MKIFTSEQTRKIDDYTISYEPIASVDLMERAAVQLFNWYVSRFGRSQRVFIFAGPGNNGGDGLALARMLDANRYDVEVYYIDFTEKRSADWDKNWLRLSSETKVPLNYLTNPDQFPVITSGDVIIDAIFGSGLTRQTDGLPAMIIHEINRVECVKISVDIPSGLFGEDNSNNSYENVIKANYTLCFQFPKLSFLLSENSLYTGEWFVLPIGLNSNIIHDTPSPFTLLEKECLKTLLKKRNRFDHKGNYGHGLLVAGSSGKVGSCILGAGAAMRTGIGLLTCHVPACASPVIHCTVPEAMVQQDNSDASVSDVGSCDQFSAVGVGPGLGTAPETQKALFRLLKECKEPMVIDADALNILSVNKEWLSDLPGGTILTPHPKEFERLAGKCENGYSRLMKQIEFSREYNCTVVLKGAFTSVTTNEGNVLFNSTGNPGMATAGSGDVLTGIILSLLAQGLKPVNAAILGVFLHGTAGDIAAGESCFESLIASDIINCIGKAFNKIRET
jgi:ADP-dependent NAD(P)H-hydrate dehydratase / NAD(P)H-hydrate epimerase